MADEATLDTLAANQQTIITKLTTLSSNTTAVKNGVNAIGSSVEDSNIIGAKGTVVETHVTPRRTFVISPWPPEENNG